MAKGKFRKNMHAREQELQSLRNEYCKPTPSGQAASNSYREHYFDNLIDDLYKKAEENGMKKGGGKRVILEENHCLFRFHQKANEAKTTKSLKVSIYFNCPNLLEFSNKYEVIIEGKTIYFVPIDTGYTLVDSNTTFPYLGIANINVTEDLKASGIEADKPYKLRELPRRRNIRVFYIEV